MLYLPGHPLAGRAEAQLDLPARQHGRPAIGGEETVQKARDLVAGQGEDNARHELVAGRPTPDPERLEPTGKRVAFGPSDGGQSLGSELVRVDVERGAEVVEHGGARDGLALTPVRDRGGRHAETRREPSGGASRADEPSPHERAELDSSLDKLGPVGRHGEGRRPVARRLLANRKASEPPDRFAKVGPELLTAIGEARASPREGAVAQEIGEELDAGLSQRPLAEHVDAPRDGDVVAGVDLGERPPPLDGEKRVTPRGAHRAPETGRHLENGLVAIVDEGRRLGRREFPLVGQREEPPRACLDDLLDHADAAVREHDLGVGGETLPHARSSRHDDQIRRLQPREQPVEVGEAGRHAGHRLLVLVEAFDRLDRIDQHVGQLRERRPHPPLGDVEDHLLGPVEELGHIAARFVAAGGDLGGGGDEAAENRPVADDPRVVDDVRRGRHALGQLRQEGGTPHVGEIAAEPEGLGERDQVDGLAAIREREHGAEELPVRAAVEVVGLEQLHHPVERRVVEEHAAQHRLLGLDTLRRDPTERLVDRRHPHPTEHAGGRRRRERERECVASPAAPTQGRAGEISVRGELLRGRDVSCHRRRLEHQVAQEQHAGECAPEQHEQRADECPRRRLPSRRPSILHPSPPLRPRSTRVRAARAASPAVPAATPASPGGRRAGGVAGRDSPRAAPPPARGRAGP